MQQCHALALLCLTFFLVVAVDAGTFRVSSGGLTCPANAQFPPAAFGSMRPLGSHRDADGHVLVYEGGLPAPDFFFGSTQGLGAEPQPHLVWNDNLGPASAPVLFRNAARHWPAFERWTDDFLRKTAGDARVDVERSKKEDRLNNLTVSIALSEFLDKYLLPENKDYLVLVSPVPAALRDDLHLRSDYLLHMRKLHEPFLWFSSGGGASVLHSDQQDNINCLLAGEKDWIFIDKIYQDRLYYSSRHAGYGMRSLVDVDRVDLGKFPLIGEVPWTYAHVKAGDCIYLPAGYFHQVRSRGRNLAVNLWFDFVADPDADEGAAAAASAVPADGSFTRTQSDGTAVTSLASTHYWKGTAPASDAEADSLAPAPWDEHEQGQERVVEGPKQCSADNTCGAPPPVQQQLTTAGSGHEFADTVLGREQRDKAARLAPPLVRDRTNAAHGAAMGAAAIVGVIAGLVLALSLLRGPGLAARLLLAAVVVAGAGSIAVLVATRPQGCDRSREPSLPARLALSACVGAAFGVLASVVVLLTMGGDSGAAAEQESSEAAAGQQQRSVGAPRKHARAAG